MHLRANVFCALIQLEVPKYHQLWHTANTVGVVNVRAAVVVDAVVVAVVVFSVGFRVVSVQVKVEAAAAAVVVAATYWKIIRGLTDEDGGQLMAVMVVEVAVGVEKKKKSSENGIVIDFRDVVL